MNYFHNGDELRSLLAETAHSDVSEIGLDDDLTSFLQLDSLGQLLVLVAVEKHFGVEFPFHQLSELGTLRKLLDALDKEGVAS